MDTETDEQTPLTATDEQTSLTATNEQTPLTATDKQIPLTATDKQTPLTTTDKQTPMTAADEQTPLTAADEQTPLTATDKQTPLTATGAATIHPKRQNISFGRWAMPVMAQKMQESDAPDRKRAVQSLCDYVYDSRRVASKEFASVVLHLKNLHQDEDDEVRLKVAECFSAITSSAAGRLTFNKHDFYQETLDLLDDNQESVRRIANIVIQRMASSPLGSKSTIKAGAIERLIKRIPQESDAVLVVLLQALHACCLVDPDKALTASGIETLSPLLSKTCPRVREKAATVVKDLTVEANGRNQALELPSQLLNLCLEEDDLLKAKALSAIMMIANSTEGKFISLENGAIEKIFPLLRSENTEIRLNTVKVLTALSEAPEGRKICLDKFREIIKLLNDEFLEIRKAAEKLMTVVKFMP